MDSYGQQMAIFGRSFGPKLKALRRLRGLSQFELADKLDLGPMTVSKWERGIHLPESGNMQKIAKALGVDKDYFRDDVDHKDPASAKYLNTNRAKDVDKKGDHSTAVASQQNLDAVAFSFAAALLKSISALSPDHRRDVLGVIFRHEPEPLAEMLSTLELLRHLKIAK